jgi:hypothetical protein
MRTLFGCDRDLNVVFPVRFWHLDSVSPPAVQELGDVRIRIPTADVVSTEDTGWRVGGELAHMMIFVTVTATVFQVRDHHRYEEVREVIGDDYPGVLVTDRCKSYDAKELEEVYASMSFHWKLLSNT